MTNTKILVVGLFVVAIIGLFTFYLAGKYVTAQSANAHVSTYINTAYGYQFQYDSPNTVNEYTPEQVDVGRANATGGFDALAGVEVIKSGEETEFDSFDEFVIARSTLLCDADGPDETLSCPNVIGTDVVITYKGLSGVRIDLELRYENRATGQVATSTFGSVYAFNIGPNVPDSKYGALILYTPLSVADESPIIERILHTLQLSRIER